MALGLTSFPNGADAFPADQYRSVVNQASGALTAADSGKTFIVSASGTTTYTLPATAPGIIYTMAWKGANGGGTLQFAPAAADGIAGAGVATVINKALILAAATIKKGDYVTISSGYGVTGVTAWAVTVQHGVLTKQA